MKRKLLLIALTALVPLLLVSLALAVVNGNGDDLERFSIGAGGGTATQANGCTISLTIVYTLNPSETPSANAHGASLTLGFQALVQQGANCGDWTFYE